MIVLTLQPKACERGKKGDEKKLKRECGPGLSCAQSRWTIQHEQFQPSEVLFCVKKFWTIKRGARDGTLHKTKRRWKGKKELKNKHFSLRLAAQRLKIARCFSLVSLVVPKTLDPTFPMMQHHQPLFIRPSPAC